MTLPRKIARRGLPDLLLAALAFVLLVFFRVCLVAIPVRRIIQAVTPAPDRGGTKPADAAASDRALQLALRVQWAVSAVARHSFVEFVCFPQTLAAYTLLRWRRVNSTMVYGVARSPKGDLIAHTWLEVGDKIVTGGEGAPRFTSVERWG
jgi:hypothetical protein